MKFNKTLFLISLICASQAKAINVEQLKNLYGNLSVTQKIASIGSIATISSVFALYKYIQSKNSNYNRLLSEFKCIEESFKELNISKEDINEGKLNIVSGTSSSREAFIDKFRLCNGDIAIYLKNKKSLVIRNIYYHADECYCHLYEKLQKDYEVFVCDKEIVYKIRHVMY